MEPLSKIEQYFTSENQTYFSFLTVLDIRGLLSQDEFVEKCRELCTGIGFTVLMITSVDIDQHYKIADPVFQVCISLLIHAVFEIW